MDTDQIDPGATVRLTRGKTHGSAVIDTLALVLPPSRHWAKPEGRIALRLSPGETKLSPDCIASVNAAVTNGATACIVATSLDQGCRVFRHLIELQAHAQ